MFPVNLASESADMRSGIIDIDKMSKIYNYDGI